MWLLVSSFAEAVDLKKVQLRLTYGKPKSVTFIVYMDNVSIVSEEGVQHPCPKYHIGWENVEDRVCNCVLPLLAKNP